jgi:hypothetical protein
LVKAINPETTPNGDIARHSANNPPVCPSLESVWHLVSTFGNPAIGKNDAGVPNTFGNPTIGKSGEIIQTLFPIL